MPRAARMKSKTGIYHIILRGINKQTIFEDEEDRERFIQTLGEYKESNPKEPSPWSPGQNPIELLILIQKLSLSMDSHVYGWHMFCFGKHMSHKFLVPDILPCQHSN